MAFNRKDLDYLEQLVKDVPARTADEKVFLAKLRLKIKETLALDVGTAETWARIRRRNRK